MKDLLPPASGRRSILEDRAREAAGTYGYSEIRTPILEAAELYVRGVGESTDIVEKETYTFEDRGGRLVTLRPEGTAGVVRAYLEENMHAAGLPVKVFYLQPAFRSENPQAGRYRQHTQFGVELLGAADALADVEVILLARTFLSRVGFGRVTVTLNSLGCSDCRPRYREALLAYYRGVDGLCATCRERREKNPLRLLDCKEPGCCAFKTGAPEREKFLCAACADHQNRVEDLLTAQGVVWRPDKNLVRGLDYYTRTVFEIVDEGLGAQNTVCGGGRYDRLVETLGGRPTPAVGFGLGLERLQEALEKKGVVPAAPAPELLVAHRGETAAAALQLAEKARRAGIRTELELLGRSLKSQLKYADKLGIRTVAILGEDEAARGTVTVRDLVVGEQREMRRENLEQLWQTIREQEGSN